MRSLLWCFNHEMRPALAFRDGNPDLGVKIRNVRTISPADIEPADRVFASAYCYGRVLKTYEGTDWEVEEVWLQPDYRHKVEPTPDGWVLYEDVDGAWVARGEPQPSEEEAWAILDRKELGL